MDLSLPETERLYFRRHEPDDLEAFCRMEADPDFRRYVGGRPRPREEAEKRFRNTLGPANGPLGMWATVYKHGNTYIGRCGIYQHVGDEGNPIPGEAALGLYIDKPYWGLGLATEAGAAFIKFGFEELRLDRIVTTIDSRNDVSIHVIQKLGLTLELTSEMNGRTFYHFEIDADKYAKPTVEKR
jgi:ribosomal-protein-alanine N-acetyltransferase